MNVRSPIQFWEAMDRQSRLLSICVGASLFLHAVILTLHFKFPETLRWKSSQPPLEVVLVNAKTVEKPVRAEALAQFAAAVAVDDAERLAVAQQRLVDEP